MNYKIWLKYFIYILILIFVVSFGSFFLEQINADIEKSLNINPTSLNFIMAIYYGSIGGLFGLEFLYKEIKKEGKWKINYPKLIILGVPSLLISFNLMIIHTMRVLLIPDLFLRTNIICVFRNIRTAIPETSGHETGGIRTLCRLI